jgi:citrate lyase subunit beta/citryl-CoA lyase
MAVRRSVLSVPGSSERMLAKAPGLEADELVIDLEDAVVPAAKAKARQLVGDVLSGEGASFPTAVAVRVNSPTGPWGECDVVELAERVGPAIDSLVIPKVQSAEDVIAVERLLERVGEPAGGIRLQALVETAAGLLRAGEIAAASPRLDALIIGYADLGASLGRAPGDAPERWLYAQETVLVAARAAGLQAIDGPYLEIRDGEGLRRRAEHVRALGFDGKWAVHPGQLAIINATFTPLPEELARAEAILAALADAEGRGACELDGEMIDEASRKLAQDVVARGRAAGVQGGSG